MHVRRGDLLSEDGTLLNTGTGPIHAIRHGSDISDPARARPKAPEQALGEDGQSVGRRLWRARARTWDACPVSRGLCRPPSPLAPRETEACRARTGLGVSRPQHRSASRPQRV